MLLNRRRFLHTSAAALLAGGLWPGHADADGGVFRFAVLNDLHYHNDKCNPWFEKVVRTLNEQALDLILIAGDLAEHGTPAQLGAIKELLKSLKAPYHVVIGNHDYQAQTDRAAFEKEYPEKINHHFEHDGWQFVAIDTTEGQKSRGVKAPQSTFDWLDTTLPKLDKQKPTVLFTHFPLAFGVPLILINGKPILERFLPYNLRAAFSGHYHGFSELKHQGVPLTTNKCCSYFRANHDKTPQKGYFLCQTKDGQVTREFVEVKA